MSLDRIREKVANARINNEEGSDIITTLFMIPFIIGLIFVLIDVSSYFQTRSTVQNAARDGARTVALYGGSASNIPLNTTGKTVAQVTLSRIYANGKCLSSHCTAAPTVTCGPSKAISLSADAYCTITYHYQSVGGTLVQWLGFRGLLDAPINVTSTFKVETQY